MRSDEQNVPAPSEANAPDLQTRVLLLPPTSRDGDAIRTILRDAHIDCAICASLAALCAAANEAAGALIVSEESLAQGAESLATCIASQPVWSDLPILVLSRSGAESPRVATVLASLGNVSIVERPVRISTLLSLVHSAIRARKRQYEVRDDMAERQQLAEERQRLLENERLARSEAERASRIKDEFLATLSHELRTPLNAILGWAHILGSKPDASDVAEGIEVIERNARVQTQIIEDLLDMSRIISGKMRLEVRNIDLADVVRAAAETVATAARAKDIRVQLVLDSNAGQVSGDAGRLQQVFWNLLSNGIKFTPKGGRVQVVLQRINSHVEVRISDSGEGIDAAFLPHVFDRFRQAEGGSTRRHGGLGLGLAIARQLVELHGGTLGAHSSGRGQGSTFIVSLPVPPVDHPSSEEPCAVSSSSPAAPPPRASHDLEIAGVRVLVVDDEPDARAMLRRVLENCNAVVTVAASAQEALALLQTQKPDVLISDIGMPIEDGYSLIRRLRRLTPDAGGDTPAIALSAYARSEDRVQSVLAGFQHHMAKPAESEELIAMIASLARQRTRSH